MKKSVIIFGSFCFLFGFLLVINITQHRVYAQSYGDYEYTVTDGEATITKYTGPGGDITIPPTMDGFTVTTIGPNAFGIGGAIDLGEDVYWNDSLKSVTIPDSVTTIGDYAFSGCRGLTSVMIPNSVTEIGKGAFEYTFSLTSVTIPNSVTDIGTEAFGYCGLTDVIIPESVTEIGSYVFGKCANLKNVTIQNGVTTLSEGMFYKDYNLESVTVPDSVINIGIKAFAYDNSLFSVTIPNGVTSIGESTFLGCYGLTSVTIPESVKIIDRNAFSGCSNLKTLTIPNGVTSIGYNAFGGCHGLTSITIPETVTRISSLAFTSCNNLVYAEFLGNAPKISSNTFGGASDFKVYFHEGRTGFTYPWYGYKTGPFGVIPQNHTVTFNSNGGTAVAGQSIEYGGNAVKPVDPTKDSYTFAGWYIDSTFTKFFDFAHTPITVNITLYANWIDIPKNVKAVSSGYNNINLNWDAVTGASGYQIFRLNPSTGTYKFVRGTSLKHYIDKNLIPGTSYSYMIRAYSGFAGTSGTVIGRFSTVACAKPVPAAPLNTKVVSTGSNSIKVHWSPVSGASGYLVYRSKSMTGLYSLISTTPSTSITNNGLITGFTYYYKVKAYTMVGDKKVYGIYSVPADGRPSPAAPHPKAGSVGNNSIKINWNIVSGASYYQIYRATSGKGPYTFVTSTTSTTSTSFTNKGLTAGFTYFYKVRAYKSVGIAKIYGSYSTVVSAISIPATPANFTVSRINWTSIKLSYSGVSGASAFQVYQATSTTGSYHLLKDTTSLYYTNKGLTKGKTYYYKVRAYKIIEGIKVYSKWSGVKSVKL
jgi:uncharacterized repeat protein (TIGR02543 family)